MNKSALVAFAMLVLLPAGPVLSEAAEHQHDAHADSAQLQLNDGERWETDAPLRTAMQNIREVLASRIDAVHNHTLTAAQYARLADQVENEVHYMVRNCRLPPAADAELHKLVALLLQGVQEMRAGPEPSAGAAKVATALELYGRYFAHEGWQPLAEPRR